MGGRHCFVALAAWGALACGDEDSSALVGPGAFAGSGGSGAISLPGGLPGDEVFEQGTLLEVRLTMDPAAFRELEEHGNRERYVPTAARLIRAGKQDVELASMGVRHKGAYSLHHCWDEFGGVRSYELECKKLSFKLKFDEYQPEARFDGLKRLNLHASSGDLSMLRELIAYQTYRDFGVDAPRAMPARVFVNDEPQGLFIAVEDVDGRYAAAHFPSGPDGNLYKEVWPNRAVSDDALVAALETNEALADVSDMRAFAEAVARSTPATLAAELAPFAEVEPLLRYVAVDRALRNWDGIMAFYSRISPHNFYWYHADGADGRFHLIPWDLDNTLWPFDPYMAPEQWVTAAPVPDFNARPAHCEPRPIWDEMGVERITPPRCDRLIDGLASGHWARFVELGRELIAGPMAPARLQQLTNEWAPVIAASVAEDPTLSSADWQSALTELRAIIAGAGPGFEELLSEGLIDEPLPTVIEEPSAEQLDAPTTDSGLHLDAVTNFEFTTPPSTPVPEGVYAYADPLASHAVSWSTDAPISGSADLRLDFTFNRGPELYDEWTGVGIACGETDVTLYSTVVVWLSSDVPRSVRVRLASAAYDDDLGGIDGEFGVDRDVGPEPSPIAIDFADIHYPAWAKEAWTLEQGFPGTDVEARELVLRRFTGLVFGPGATLDAGGELSSERETGFLRIDNIYFR